MKVDNLIQMYRQYQYNKYIYQYRQPENTTSCDSLHDILVKNKFRYIYNDLVS